MTATPDGAPARGRLARLSADTAAWRHSREFRLLLTSRTVTQVGSMVTYVAVPYQVKLLTGSYVAVGLVGLAELLPILACGLYGGALADAMDRRRLVLHCEVALCALSALLLANAALPHPLLWPVYVLAAASAAAASLQEPAVDAILPRIVTREQMTGALALSTACGSAGRIGGPALGGVLVTAVAPTAGYAVDVASFALSLLALTAMRAVPPPDGGAAPSLSGILAGVRYAAGRQELLGTYLVDIAAMVFALPTALLPFLADHLHARAALGALYAAESVGALAVSVTSGWTGRIRRHGRAVAAAACVWGLAIAALGTVGSVWPALACLVVAGGADMVSGLFRSTIWNETIPDDLRGRLAGIELLSYASGPALGQVRGGAAAALVGVGAALWSGGLLCVAAVALLCTRLPRFLAYRGGDPRPGPEAP